MYKLSNATAKGRSNTAGCIKLAVFFLVCLIVFCACPLNASDSNATRFPFVKDGRLYVFMPEETSPSTKAYDIFGASNGYAQRAVCASKKNGFVLAWNSKTQYLYHVNSNAYASSKVKLGGSIAYVNKKYVLVQSNSFAENKGFSFTLYSIKYSWNNKKISLKKIWGGNIDCFVSDCFFTSEGVCISGGTQDNSKNNVFYITGNGIHKCFSTAKNSDFLRLINCGTQVYGFLSGREKTYAQPVIYKFTLDNYIEGSDSQSQISLKNDPLLPQDYECFFGYGFVTSAVVEPVEGGENTSPKLILPASINGLISFIVYDTVTNKISTVTTDAVGCSVPLGQTSDGFYYIARDPTIEDSWYGIALFDGNSCKKIKKIQ